MEKMTGDEFLDRAQDIVARVSALLADVAKVSAIVSVPVGIFLVFTYCLSSGAPFPTADLLTSGGLAAVVAVLFVALALSLWSMVWIPAFTGWQNTKYFEAARSCEGSRSKISTGVELYGLLLGPWLVIVLTLLWFLITYPWGKWSFIVVLVAGWVAWWAWHRTQGDATCSTVFRACLPSVSWLLLPLIFALFLLNKHYIPSSGWSEGFAIVVVFIAALIVHFVSMFYFNEPRKIAGAFLVFLFAFLFFPSAIAYPILALLGLGGDLPVSLTIKPPDSASEAKEVSGCLVLAIGSDVYLRADDKKHPCNPPLPATAAGKLCGTELFGYPRTEILRMKRFRKPEEGQKQANNSGGGKNLEQLMVL